MLILSLGRREMNKQPLPKPTCLNSLLPFVIYVLVPKLSLSLVIPGGALGEVLAFPSSALLEPQIAKNFIFCLIYKKSIDMHIVYSSRDSGQNILFSLLERSD